MKMGDLTHNNACIRPLKWGHADLGGDVFYLHCIDEFFRWRSDTF
jgi:hypothetical protein